jgi:hypothetical protein
MNDCLLTLPEMAEILDPPLSAEQLKLLIKAIGIQPEGRRYTGAQGRPAPCYRASIVMRVHAAVVPLVQAAGASTWPSQPPR